VYFESNNAESEEVATMLIEAWRRIFFSQTKNEKLESGATGCDD
jgi:hypothetical protein